MTDSLRELSLEQLARGLREGGVTAVELAEEALSRARLGAYRRIDEARTLRQAEAADAALRAGYDLGPLQGIPLSIKDLYGVPGYDTFAGSPRALPARFERPGPMVTAALRQLAVVTGKTHTVEFAFGGLGINPHHPTPVNPWDGSHHRAPGGSTSGGGVSLVEGSAALALGTDTAGSVRIPAAWTGAVALKTTKGRWSTEGVVPLSPTLDTPGILARSVADLEVAFAVFESSSVRISALEKSRLRLGRSDGLLFEGCSPGVVEAVEAALGELTAAGARLRSVELPEVTEADELFRLGGPVSVELHRFLKAELPGWLDTLDPNVGARIGAAAELPAGEYLERLGRMRALATAVDGRLSDVDALVCPTVASSPPRLDEIDTPEGYGPRNLLCLRNTAVVSYLGLSAITLPAGLDALGMPVGLQLIGRAGRERQLLGIARLCEAVLGTPRQRLGLAPRCRE